MVDIRDVADALLLAYEKSAACSFRLDWLISHG